MDQRYEVYALADQHFYETPDRLSAAGKASPLFETAGRAVPEGWRAGRIGDWLALTPLGPEGDPLPGPTQGWKVHASATRANAERIASTVWDYCVPRGIPFKFLPGPHLLHLRNTKYAGRDGSGKFVTIYPADEDLLHQVLTELGVLLEGCEGPYILTDLRWHDGPLYVRYGAFARSFVVDERGSLVPAVRDGEGRLVPDRRAPSFQVPEWVRLPEFLEAQLAARNATTVADLPYRIEKALHFSNGGGVYVGTDTRDGRRVVLKEGRPHAGLAADGADAITRLERERSALEQVSGLGTVPEVRDWFTLGDHRFLVMDFVEGRPLNSFFAERHPLLTHDPDPEAVAAYTRWALRIHRAVEETVEAVHARGIVFNDLHIFNIMVAPDEESVSLVDFEAAAPAEERGRQVVAHPGFFAPPDRRGTDVDRYALACLRLALFMPLTTLFVVDRGKAAHLAEVIAGQFPDVPAEFLAEAVAEITRDVSAPGAGRPAPSPPAAPVEPGDWPHSRDSMVKAILASATPERDDRLFPGDITQFSDGGGLGLAHGAAGVLYALSQAGAERYEEGERWLLAHTDPVPVGTPLGLYDGLAGVAHVLDLLGHRPRALDLIDLVLREKWHKLSSDLRGGLAGLGLVLDGLARTTGETEFARAGPGRHGHPGEPPGRAAPGPAEAPRRAAARRERARAALPPAVRGDRRPRAARRGRHGAAPGPGLLRRPAGRRPRGRRGLADHALPRGRQRGHRPGPRRLPGARRRRERARTYADGHEDFEEARDRILTSAASRFYAQPGLFQGRAGMVLHLARTGAPEARQREQIAGLGWYAMSYQGQLAFPGHQMMRLSMDLGTGTAGCLLALGAALDETAPAALPFLPPPRRPHDAAPHQES